MRILIAIPSAGEVPVEFINCIDKIKTRHEVARLYIARSIVHIAREQAAEMAIKEGYDALLFLDDDMVFDPNIIDVLTEASAPVVSAPCFKRCYPYDPCFYEKLEVDGNRIIAHPFDFREMPQKPFPAVSAGTACMLIRTEVFKKLTKPYFLPLPYAGEDLTFCMRLGKIGIGVLIQPKARVGHLQTRAVYFEHYKEAHENEERKRGADNSGGSPRGNP